MKLTILAFVAVVALDFSVGCNATVLRTEKGSRDRRLDGMSGKGGKGKGEESKGGESKSGKGKGGQSKGGESKSGKGKGGKGKGGKEALCDPACDDGDLCTIDTCENGVCLFEDVVCPTDTACNPADGQCLNIEEIIPCIAIIDEADNNSDLYFTNLWDTFRMQFPNRPFCLLQPASTTSGLFRPAAFLNDTLARTSLVNRDGGNVALASDWFSLCDLGSFLSSSIEFVGLFVDNSGSMTTATVQASYDQFLSVLNQTGITFITVENSAEDWITPFLTELV